MQNVEKIMHKTIIFIQLLKFFDIISPKYFLRYLYGLFSYYYFDLQSEHGFAISSSHK
jgi:hypothetical protein